MIYPPPPSPFPVGQHGKMMKSPFLCVQEANITERDAPPTPLQSPPPSQSPRGGGGRHFTVLLSNIYCGGLSSPSVAHTFLHCFPITSNQSPV